MGLNVIRMGRCANEPDEPSRIIGPVGKQLHHLAQDWPELQGTGAIVGVYHALGREKLDVHQVTVEQIVSKGFDSLRVSAMVFEHMTYGPFAQLAITYGCTGPFWTLEANELAAPLALWTAWHDLQKKRCDLAIIGAYRRKTPTAWMLLVSQDDTSTLEPALIHTNGHTHPTTEHLHELKQRLGGDCALLTPTAKDHDTNGFDALYQSLTQAQAGQATAIWRSTPDGRGTLLGFRRRDVGTLGAT
jgi:hypothetical protein